MILVVAVRGLTREVLFDLINQGDFKVPCLYKQNQYWNAISGLGIDLNLYYYGFQPCNEIYLY